MTSGKKKKKGSGNEAASGKRSKAKEKSIHEADTVKLKKMELNWTDPENKPSFDLE